jgi:CRISPR system Cascade subunit CasA
MNLINSRWIPVRRQSGTEGLVSPIELLDDDSPVALLWPRADMNLACLELLIGLMYVADPPENESDWRKRAAEPDRSALQEAFDELAPFFELEFESGGGFLQSFEALDDGDVVPIERLLIDAPGNQTVKNNADLFVHRSHSPVSLSKPVAAMLLYTFQAFAPAGGAGNRTSMRGGGPMVTLIEPHPDATLYDIVWANVPNGDPLALGNATAVAQSFAWTAATPVSKEKGSTLQPYDEPKDAPHWACFFGMPRRLRLVYGYEPAVCSLSGVTEQHPIIGFRQRPYGIDYGIWRHPTSPYYRTKVGAELLPLHPKPGRFGYRAYEGVLFRSPSGLKERASSVDTFCQSRRTAGEPTRMLMGGWAMDNMRALDFVTSRPNVAVGVLSKQSEDFAVRAADAAGTMASMLAIGVKNALSVEFKMTDPATLARTLFFQRTEPDFERLVNDLMLEPSNRSEAVTRYLDALVEAALNLFDERTLSTLSTGDVERAHDVAKGRSMITLTGRGYSKSGKEVFSKLGLEPPVSDARSKKRASARKAQKTGDAA